MSSHQRRRISRNLETYFEVPPHLERADKQEPDNQEADNSASRHHRYQQQIQLFLYLSTTLRPLAARIAWEMVPGAEHRRLQRELAELKKAAQSARKRLKASKNTDSNFARKTAGTVTTKAASHYG